MLANGHDLAVFDRHDAFSNSLVFALGTGLVLLPADHELVVVRAAFVFGDIHWALSLDTKKIQRIRTSDTSNRSALRWACRGQVFRCGFWFGLLVLLFQQVIQLPLVQGIQEVRYFPAAQVAKSDQCMSG